MFNLGEMWSHATPGIKLMFWSIIVTYTSAFLLILFVLGSVQGYVITWEQVAPNLPRVFGFLAVWPTFPAMLLVLVDGAHHRKFSKNNPENIEA